MVDPTDPPAARDRPFEAFVRTVSKSADLLEELIEGPKYKRELAANVGVSKSTIYNWTSELREHDLVEKTDTGYELTVVGHIHAELFFHWRTVAERMRRAEPTLNRLPTDCRPPIAAFENAEVVSSTPDPDAPLARLLEYIDGAETVSGILPVASSRLLSFVASQFEAGDLTLHVEAPPSTFEFVESEFFEFVKAVETAPDSTFERTRWSPSFGLLLFQGSRIEVCLIACTPHGHLSGLVGMAGAETVDWAGSVLDRLQGNDAATGSEDAEFDLSDPGVT